MAMTPILAMLLLAGPEPQKLPLGFRRELWEISVPVDRRPTAAQVALGDKLFNDKRLSKDDSTSCATCHDPKRAFTDGKARAEGLKKQVGQRNSPTVANALFNATQFWDGRAATLEDQAVLPITNPIEMGMDSGDEVVAKLKGLPEYVSAFKDAFGADISYEHVGRALAAFERKQVFGDSPFDRYLSGDAKALDASAKRGWMLFNSKARCQSCHSGNAVAPLFSDAKFHNIGVAAHKQDFVQLAGEALKVVRSGDQKQIDELALGSKFSELGRFMVTKSENDIGSFKTPTLRNIGVTGPYMHDGSFATLWDVMDHYNKGGLANPYLDGGMQRLGLTEAEIDDLVAFLFSLTSDTFAAVQKSELAKQKALKGKRPERDTDSATGKKNDLGDVGPTPDFAKKDPSNLGLYGPLPEH
ncbi:MAG: cytochrome-c peroxidase [Archangiaceae bacterium]|nr:cytochrome-c peroxidase [Archangiaceae bacterium]